jgi:hypothetical protein
MRWDDIKKRDKDIMVLPHYQWIRLWIITISQVEIKLI